MNSRSGFPNAAISRLEDMMPAVEGEASLTVGPYSPREATWHEIEAVRVAGWERGENRPLAHAKLLVLGEIGWVTYQYDYGEYEEFRFVPERVWWGSANWTKASTSHLEIGFVCDDPRLVDEASDFVATVIAFSEPVGSTCAGPEPNLVHVDYDDAAMAEADEASRPDCDEDEYP